MNRKYIFISGIFCALVLAFLCVKSQSVYAAEITHDTISIASEDVDAEFAYGDPITLHFNLQTLNINYLEYYYVYIYDASNKELCYYRGTFDRSQGCPYSTTYTYSVNDTLPIGKYSVKIKTTYNTATVTYFEVIEKTCKHQIVIDPSVEATYSKSGLTQGRHCSICGEILTAQTVIARKPLPFKDVSSSSWAYNAVCVMLDRGIMNGTTTTTFSPSSNLTRAQLVVMLWNYEGMPVVSTENTFSDVPSGKYYTKAVNWAKSTGIVNGSNGKFNPGGAITRQDFVVILKNYAAYKGLNVEIKDKTAYTACADYKNVSSYALSSIQWAYERGLIGANGSLAPKSQITRAEAAAILQRFLGYYSI